MWLMVISLGFFGLAQGCRHLKKEGTEKRVQERDKPESRSVFENAVQDLAFPESPLNLANSKGERSCFAGAAST